MAVIIVVAIDDAKVAVLGGIVDAEVYLMHSAISSPRSPLMNSTMRNCLMTLMMAFDLSVCNMRILMNHLIARFTIN